MKESKTKITFEALVDIYKFEKIALDSEKTRHIFEFKRALDRHCALVIADDFSFKIEYLISSYCINFDNEIIYDCDCLERIWEFLTGNKII